MLHFLEKPLLRSCCTIITSSSNHMSSQTIFFHPYNRTQSMDNEQCGITSEIQNLFKFMNKENLEMKNE